MKKITKTMMIIGGISGIYGMASYVYKKNNKKLLKKYENYLEKNM